MQNRYRQISLLFLIFLLLVLFLFDYTPTNDGDGYIKYARMCIDYGEPYPCAPTINGQPFIWNIGQINLVALSLYLFHSVYPILVLMCFLKATSAYLLARIAQKTCNDQIGLIALLLYVCYPNNWGQSTTLLSEIPPITLLLGAVFIILHTTRVRHLFIAGTLMAVANWFRPISLIFIGTFFLYFLFFKNKQWLRSFSSLLAGYTLFILVVGTSCWLRTGYFLYQSETLWFNMAAATYETSVEPHYNTEAYPKGTIRYIENMKDKTAIECNQIWKQRCLEWLKDNKANYLSKIPGRLVYMYMNDMDNIPAFLPDKSKAQNNYVTLPYRTLLYNLQNLSYIQWLGLLNMTYYAFLLLAFVFSLHVLRSEKRYDNLFLLCCIVIGGSLALVLAVHGETRFKAPFMPFIFMGAAVGIHEIINKRRAI